MRLVEFLILLLRTHAETLQRLAAYFGEEEFFEILESSPHSSEGDSAENSGRGADGPRCGAGDQGDPHGTGKTPRNLLGLSFEKPAPNASERVYQELEGAIRELSLPAVLEFHLWAYPYYRMFIESSLDLNSRIPGPGGNTGTVLVEEAVAQAQSWIRELRIPPQLSAQAERAAFVPWLRFRSTALKRIGRRPLGPVY